MPTEMQFVTEEQHVMASVPMCFPMLLSNNNNTKINFLKQIKIFMVKIYGEITFRVRKLIMCFCHVFNNFPLLNDFTCILL